MAANAGIREGEFVRFNGWDLSGNEQAYLPNLRGNVAALKRTVLEKQGNLFLAFNTNGWIKSWAVLDFNSFTRSPGVDLYVRVEFPGFIFIQGRDSASNNMERITDVSTATALRERVVEKFAGDNRIAAFNTDGWIKSRVRLPPTDFPERRNSLAGIYIRTKYLDFNFFQGRDSLGDDIRQTEAFVNDIPQLIRSTESLSGSAGFNTNGWHKRSLAAPPPPSSASLSRDPWQGIYYRTCWPDFVHLPGLDSPGNDIRNVGNLQVHQLVAVARSDPNAMAVNTDGRLKSRLITSDPVDIPGAENLKGIYVKYINPGTWRGSNVVDASGTLSADQQSLLSTAIFALKGTAIIWARWVLKDAVTRAEYSRAVSTATADILARVNSGAITPADAASEAHGMRNNFLIGMRERTSPIGLMVARSIKPAGGQYDYYLNRNAKRRYNRDFKDLTEAEARIISVDTIESAGRANPNVTAFMRRASFVSKGVFVVAIAASVYSVATAPQWETELGRQVVSWSGAIAGGELGVGVGAILGPVGAILGGIAGSILGGLGAGALANWFFGGSSGRSASELLGEASVICAIVEGKMATLEVKCYVHILRAKHSTAAATSALSPATAEEMIEEIPTARLSAAPQEGEDEVLATIVWILVEGRALPTNARNPGDMVALMEYVKRNLP